MSVQKLAVSIVLLALGCADGTRTEPSGRISLLEVEDRDDWAPTGLAFDATTSRLYVLDAFEGLYVLDESGALIDRIAIAADELPGLTDLALTGGTISVLSDHAGFRLDQGTGALEEYFCLEPAEPDPVPDPEPQTSCEYHVSGGLTFQAEGLVVAAPHYRDCDTRQPTRTLLEGFDTTTGAIAWQLAVSEPTFFGGLAWDAASSRFFAASAGEVVTIDAETGGVRSAGVDDASLEDAQGLALDAAGRRLWVLDAASLEIVRYDVD